MRFRLRTLFVVVTLLAAALWWLVGEWKLVQARKTALAEIAARQGCYAAVQNGQPMPPSGTQPPLAKLLNDLDPAYVDPKLGKDKRTRWPPPYPPFVRQFMGDAAINMIWVPVEMQGSVGTLRDLFPEAMLRDAAAP